MKTIKVSEATDAALDWLVATCEGYEIRPVMRGMKIGVRNYEHEPWWVFTPSNDPAQAYPIIDREGIGFFCNRTAKIGARYKPDAGADWRAFALNKHGEHFFGPTPLIAAMRCRVVSKLGKTVEVPEELT